jgi:hypothetical protein
MAGSLLVCQEIKVSPDDLKKISAGTFISPSDIVGASVSEETKHITEALQMSQQQAAAAHAAEERARNISTAIAVGSFLVMATGLYLSWVSRPK